VKAMKVCSTCGDQYRSNPHDYRTPRCPSCGSLAYGPVPPFDVVIAELRERIEASRYDSGLDGWWAGRVEKVLDALEQRDAK